MAKARRQYSARVKFQVVLELLTGEKTPAQIGKAYGIHPNSIGRWKQCSLEHGSSVSERSDSASGARRQVVELEQPLGTKEVEIALLETGFLARSE